MAENSWQLEVENGRGWVALLHESWKGGAGWWVGKVTVDFPVRLAKGQREFMAAGMCTHTHSHEKGCKSRCEKTGKVS